MKNRDLPHLPPVEKVELPARPTWARVVAVLLLLAVGAAALSYGVFLLVAGEKGVQRIDAARAETSAVQDFVFLYDLGAGETSASNENRALSALYGSALNTACKALDAYAGYEGVNNLYTLNTHPNAEYTVDPVLYQALEQLQAAGDRTLYLGPMVELYDDVFACTDDAAAAWYDPAQSPEMARYYADVAAFASDPAMVDVRLLGDDRVMLFVAPEYARFAEENGVVHYLDPGWLQNAFIVDWVADAVAAAGYTRGQISSVDGFERLLDETAQAENGAILAGHTLRIDGACALVTLRAAPYGAADAARYYTFADGTVLSLYLDPADGVCRAALPVLAGASRTAGCAAVALRLAPFFIADTFDAEGADALAAAGICPIYQTGGRTVCALPGAQVD